MNKLLFTILIIAAVSCGTSSEEKSPYEKRKPKTNSPVITEDDLNRQPDEEDKPGTDVKEPIPEDPVPQVPIIDSPITIKAGKEVIVEGCNKPDLKDFDSKTYYQGLDKQNGKELEKYLNLILRGHHSYHYSKCTKEILKDLDQDPNDPSKVITIYKRNSLDASFVVGGGNNDPDAWNREHVWPRSHGFQDKNDRKNFAFTDIHNLRVSDQTVNNVRSSKYFAEGGDVDSECSQCKFTDNTWEPPKEVKGDIARGLLYMDIRYNGNDETVVPDLKLVGQPKGNEKSEFGNLCNLLKWHEEDPISNDESLRNERAYLWQGNRNPFVDRADWVQAIWGLSKDCK